MKKYNDYYVTIGLEVHVALKTSTKLFSRSENTFNTNLFSLFDCGTPGVLPVLADKPVEMAVAFAIACSALPQKYSEFERKHYFYPDLPLGYQITQQNKPIMIGGLIPIEINGEIKNIQIEHAHLECDAAKSIHSIYEDYTAIDIARAASPLLEIVSTPCMHSPEEAKEYAKTIHSLAMYLEITDGKMEEGSFRVDASISLNKEIGKLGTRVEIKNISSFNFLECALEYEIKRQSELLDDNLLIIMETRLFNEQELTTKSMRTKETVDEYRLMPDPDILPLMLSDEYIDKVSVDYKVNFFENRKKLQLLLEENDILSDLNTTDQYLLSDYNYLWEELLKEDSISLKSLKLLAYWLPEITKDMVITRKLSVKEFKELSNSNLESREIKETYSKWLNSDLSLIDCLPNFMSEENILKIIMDVFIEYAEQIEKVKQGDTKILQFIIGKVMSQVKGKYPASLIKEKVTDLLKN